MVLDLFLLQCSFCVEQFAKLLKECMEAESKSKNRQILLTFQKRAGQVLFLSGSPPPLPKVFATMFSPYALDLLVP
jgi:hypothetical protein